MALEVKNPSVHTGELRDMEFIQYVRTLSRIGEGNGNPLQCSCLENPRDGGAWWAAVYGVAQSWTRVKRLSSSSKTLRFERILIFQLCIRKYYFSTSLFGEIKHISSFRHFYFHVILQSFCILHHVTISFL